jgi:hypothetical protein
MRPFDRVQCCQHGHNIYVDLSYVAPYVSSCQLARVDRKWNVWRCSAYLTSSLPPRLPLNMEGAAFRAAAWLCVLTVGLLAVGGGAAAHAEGGEMPLPFQRTDLEATDTGSRPHSGRNLLFVGGRSDPQVPCTCLLPERKRG